MTETESRDHEDHIAGEGFNSLSHHNLVHKPVPILQAMKIPDAKAAVDKEWDKFEKLQAWKSRAKKKGIGKATKRRKDSSFCYADEPMPTQELGVGAKVPNI